MQACANCGHESAESFEFCPKCGTRRVAGQGGLIGSTLNGKYRVTGELGEGAMGSVYLAEHVSLGKRFALKLLHRDLQLSEEGLQRFQREGIAAGQVTHPNAIQIFDFDRTEDGRYFLAMEFVEGSNLKQVLEDGPLPTDTALNLSCQLLSALVEAHTHGIIHRDLKPENLMVISGATGEKTLKVLDFGLSKLVDKPMSKSMATQPGRVMGTPMYMAPEQWKGREADTRTDLYAVAAILFEMVSGQPPFQGSDLADSMLKATTQDAPNVLDVAPQADLPRGLDDFLAIGLAKNPEQRFQTAGDMLADLREFSGAASSSPVRRRTRPRAAAKPSRTPWIVGGVAGAAALGLGLWLAMRGPGDDASDGAPGRTDAAVAMVRDKAEPTADERSYLRLLDSARSALARGDRQLALGSAGDALRMPCADAEGYLVRAAIFRSSGDRDTARADLREALDRNPNYALARARMAWLDLESDDAEAAASGFDRALRTDPACGEAVAGRAAALLAGGDSNGARRAIEAAPEEARAHPMVQLQLGRVALVEGEDAAAVDAFVAAKRADASAWQAYVGLADAYASLGQATEAERELRAALGLVPDDAALELRIRLATLLVDDGREAQAAEELGPSRRGEPREVLELRGLIALGSDDLDEALFRLQAAEALEGSDEARLSLLIGQICLLQQDWTVAEEYFARACEADDTNARAYFGWGMALLRLDRHQRAASRFKRASELDPDDAQAHLNAGILYRDYVGDTETALEAFRAHRRAGGSDPRVPGWIRALEN